MDAVDIAGFLEFDSIVLRDGLLESSEAVQQFVAEKWPFAEEPGPQRSGAVEGEVVYLGVEEEDDRDVDVEGDETASVTRPPENIGSQGVSGQVHDIGQTRVPRGAEFRKQKSDYGSEHSEGVAECDGSSLLPPAAVCSVRLRHFSSEASRANRVRVATESLAQTRSNRGEGITDTPPSSGSDVQQIPKVKTGKIREPRTCSDESDGVPRRNDVSTGGSGVVSERGGTRAPSLGGAEASALPETAGDTRAFLWKSTLGVCGICGKIFNNNSNLKRHAHVHGGGILLTCDVCGQFFPDRWALWRHKDRHAVKIPSKLYECSVCGKCVNSLHSLRKHRAQHVQPYVCDVCGESFHRASGLHIHKYLHAR